MRPRRLLLQVMRMEAARRGVHEIVHLLTLRGTYLLLLLLAADFPRRRLLLIAAIIQFGILLRPLSGLSMVRIQLLRRSMGHDRPPGFSLTAARVLGAFRLLMLRFVGRRLHQILLESFELIRVNLDFSDALLLLLGRHVAGRS